MKQKLIEIAEAFNSISMMTDTADIEFALSDDGKCRAECCEGENVKHSVSVHSLSSADFTRSQSAVFP